MPSRYREELAERCDGQMVITIDLVDPACVFTPYRTGKELKRS